MARAADASRRDAIRERERAAADARAAAAAEVLAKEPFMRRVHLEKASNRPWWGGRRAAVLREKGWAPIDREREAHERAGLPWPPPRKRDVVTLLVDQRGGTVAAAPSPPDGGGGGGGGSPARAAGAPAPQPADALTAQLGGLLRQLEALGEAPALPAGLVTSLSAIMSRRAAAGGSEGGAAGAPEENG